MIDDSPEAGRPEAPDIAEPPARSHDRAVVVWFVVLAYALSWAWWVPLAIDGTTVVAGRGWPTHLIGLMGPALAAIVVTAVAERGRGLADLWSRIVRWRVEPVWYGVIALTAAIALIPVVIGPDLHLDDLLSYSGAPSAGIVVVPYVIVVNGFGEEIGWRGLLADRLLRTSSPGRTALIVWPIWAGWHLPLFWVVGNFSDFGVAEVAGWVIGLGFGSVLLTWLYQSANRSILVVALWHSAYNFASATDAGDGLPAVLVSAAVIAVAVVVLRRPATWSSPRADDP